MIVIASIVRVHAAPANLNKQELPNTVVTEEVQAPVQQQVLQPKEKERPAKAEKKKQEEPKKVLKPKAVMPKPTGNRALGKQLASAKGWTGSQWSCLDKLWQGESGWRHTVANYEGSGAYGIPQSLPASKMATHGNDYLTNPKTQIRWGLDYIANRYKTPCGALSFWNSKSPHWY